MVTSIDKNPRWTLFDAEDKVLGRLATEIATELMGKNRPQYVPNMLSGGFVVVVNAEKVRVTGEKHEQKVYVRHSGRPGGRKEISYQRMMETHPMRIIEHAVKGMLPKNKLGSRMMTRLKVYTGDKHPHSAQVKQLSDE